MKTFKFTISSHIGDTLTKSIKAETIQDALVQVCKECIEEDNTGYFFELEDANLDYLEKQDNFYKIKVDGYEYGVILDDLHIMEGD